MMQKTILIVLLVLIFSRFHLFHQNKQNDKSNLIDKKQDATSARALRKNNLIQKRK